MQPKIQVAAADAACHITAEHTAIQSADDDACQPIAAEDSASPLAADDEAAHHEPSAAEGEAANLLAADDDACQPAA